MMSEPGADPHAMSVWRDARVLHVRGPGAAEFLQGYLTCDTERINASRATPMAICNIKGRVLASGWAVAVPDGVDLIVHASLVEPVALFLKPYVTFARCELTAGEPGYLCMSDAQDGVELMQDVYVRMVDSPPAADAEDASEQMTRRLVAARFAFVSAAVSEQYLPQMLKLDKQGAVDFDKGCYLGQEIVARAQFRGAVKRTLVPFSWRDARPEVGAEWPATGIVIDASDDGQGLALAKV